MIHETVIHLDWDGPFTFDESKLSNGQSDWGIYQIYGCHPVYGTDALLYIGKAERQTFGQRLSQEVWWNYLPDGKGTKVYLGRLAGEIAPDDVTWNRMIDFAERLLIYAHRPAWNSQMNLGRLDADLQNVHVFNWGNHRALLPEASGYRWTTRSHSMNRYHVFVCGENQEGKT